MSVTVDASTLARGWLSVSTAAATKMEDRPALHRTVNIERHAHGLRLTSTDGYMLLTAWIPERDYDLDEVPGLDEVPVSTATAIDEYGRGAGLLSHLLRLAKPKDDEPPKELDVLVSLNVPWQSDVPDDEMQLEAFPALAVTIEHPEHERVQLSVYDGNFPSFKTVLADHRSQKIESIAIGQWIAQRLAKAARPHGDITPIRCAFSGKTKAISVTFGSEPEITGLVVPVRWDDTDFPPSSEEGKP